MSMKKIIVMVILLSFLAFLCSCGGAESNLVGNWICDEIHSGYPDQMTLYSDGTGTADGFTCNWTAKDGVIVFNVGNALIGTVSYEYYCDGSVLYLDDYGYTKQ